MPLTHIPFEALPPHGHRLFLAEDDDEVRTILVEVFETDGFRVSAARTGDELLALIDAACACGTRPDIIVTDHRMPGITGLEVAGILRRRGSTVPIIVMTAFARELERAHPDHAANLVFHKPFEADDLRTAVLYCLETREQDHQHNRD